MEARTILKYQKGYIFNGYTFVVNKEDVHNARDDMFVEATALLPDGWISVKERLPEPGKRVLATNGNIVGEAYITNTMRQKCISAARWHRHYGASWNAAFDLPVTHWMSLPEPPKEDAHD